MPVGCIRSDTAHVLLLTIYKYMYIFYLKLYALCICDRSGLRANQMSYISLYHLNNRGWTSTNGD